MRLNFKPIFIFSYILIIFAFAFFYQLGVTLPGDSFVKSSEVLQNMDTRQSESFLFELNDDLSNKYIKTFDRPMDIINVKKDKLSLYLDRAYGLTPDKRFLDAFIELDFLINGKRDGIVEVKYSKGGYTLLKNETVLGTLPELPTYSDFINLLTKYAKSLNIDKKIEFEEQGSFDKELFASLESDINSLEPIKIFNALQKLDADWRDEDRYYSSLKLTLKALTYLYIISPDKLEKSDILLSKAIAVSVLLESVSKMDVSEENALLLTKESPGRVTPS